MSVDISGMSRKELESLDGKIRQRRLQMLRESYIAEVVPLMRPWVGRTFFLSGKKGSENFDSYFKFVGVIVEDSWANIVMQLVQVPSPEIRTRICHIAGEAHVWLSLHVLQIAFEFGEHLEHVAKGLGWMEINPEAFEAAMGKARLMMDDPVSAAQLSFTPPTPDQWALTVASASPPEASASPKA